MHTKFVTLLIDCDCPNGKNENNCALRKQIKKDGLFKFNRDDKNLLVPTADPYRLARAEYVHAIETMNQICRDCQTKTKQ